MLACLMTLTLGACVHDGRPEAGTNISDSCEQLAQRVAHPSFKKNDDARLVLLKYVGSLDRANARLDAVRECSRVQRELFGAK